MNIVNQLSKKLKVQEQQNPPSSFTAIRNPSPRSADSCIIKQAIDENIQESVPLSRLAQKLGLSPSTMQRRFKQTHGITVRDYLKQQKLEMAKRAILFDGCSIGEAAYNAGFNHVSNFITAFKRRFGLPPALLKQQFIKNGR